MATIGYKNVVAKGRKKSADLKGSRVFYCGINCGKIKAKNAIKTRQKNACYHRVDSERSYGRNEPGNGYL
jgi:hypothetical protein